jgi:MFS family permease
VRNLIEAIVPERLGAGYRWLLASSWISDAGDGILIAAGPLLIASLTHNAFLIASGALLQWLPPLIFGLGAGVLSDRLDRKLIVVTCDLIRAAILVILSVTIITGTVSVGLALGAMFVFGTAEVFTNNSFQTLLPMLVHRDDLAVANSRIQVGMVAVDQLLGPPIGAALFVAGRAVPMVAVSVLLAAGALLITRIVLPKQVREGSSGAVWHQVVEGVRWVRGHAAVRTLVLTIFTFNITFGAAWSVLVIYARHRLGLGDLGFGLITTVGAVGGIVGTLCYGWITRRVSLGNIMRVGLIVETFTHLGLALATTPWVAMPIFFVFGAHALIWGTTSITVRQRAVPQALQGRVASVNTVGVFGGLVIGSTIGGLLAEHVGVAAPFWFAFAGSAVFVVLIWGQLVHIAHDEPSPVSAPEKAPSG